MALPALLAAVGRGAAMSAMSSDGGGGREQGALSKLGTASMNIQAITGLAKSVVGLTMSAANALNPLTALSGVFGKVVSGFGTMRDGVAALGMATSQFTKAYSPADAKRFELSFNDATAAIGKAIMPIEHFAKALMDGFRDLMAVASGPISQALAGMLDPLTEAVPKLANEMMPLVNLAGEMAEAFGGMFKGFQAGGGIESTIEALGSAFAVLEAVFTPLIRDVGELAQIFGLLTAYVVEGIADFLKSIGMLPESRPKAPDISGKGVGLAATNASMGSLDSYLAKAWSNAFSSGGGAGEKPEKVTAVTTASILALLEKWKTDAATWVKELPGNAAKALGEVIGKLPGMETARKLDRGDFRGAAKDVVDEAKKGMDRLDPRGGPLDPRTWGL